MRNVHRFYFVLASIIAFAAILTWVFSPKPLSKDYDAKEKAPILPQGFEIIAPNREFSSLLIDGDMVYGGGIEGVLQIQRSTGKIVGQLKSPIPFVMVKALLKDKRGGIWIGHENGITYYDGTQFITYDKRHGLPDNRINHIIEDSKGRLWVGTYGGAAIFDGVSWRAFTVKDGLIDNMVNVILEDSRGYMWFGSYVAPGGGITCIYKDTARHFSVKDGLFHNSITSIMEDNKQNIWTGGGVYTKGGANKLSFTGSKWTIAAALTRAGGLAGEQVRYIFQDDMKRMWFCSEYDGVAIFSEDMSSRQYLLTKENGLSDNEVKVIKKDSDNNLWLATRRGITKINTEGLKLLDEGGLK